MTYSAISAPQRALENLVDYRAALARLRAVVAGAVVRRRARRDVAALSDHLRRDVGLDRYQPSRNDWDLR